jgi:phage/plasmid-like protein (TIGR03299 family)
MVHALEIGNNGEVAFALRNEPAWHKLGTNFGADEEISTAKMLELAHLDNWNVRLEPLNLPENYRATTTSQMVVRDNPFDSGVDVLSVVGDRYKVLQNEELFAFGDGILDGGAKWESAGSIKNGKQVFGSLVVPREFTLDPNGASDTTKTYLLVHTSHDGSSSISASITPVRVVCQNTLNMALQGSKQSFKIRHTATVNGRIDEARHALDLTFAHMDSFEAMAKELFETSVTDYEFSKLVADLYPAPKDDASKTANTRYSDKVDILNELWFNSPTNENIKGTAWGALNTLTERIDYYRIGRKGGEAIISAASGFDPVVNAEKARVLTAVRSLVNA